MDRASAHTRRWLSDAFVRMLTDRRGFASNRADNQSVGGNMNTIKMLAAASAITLVTALTAVAQQPPPPYGAPMTLDAAKMAMAASEAEAKKNNWPVAIAILDTTGSLVMLQKLDNTQTGSVEIAIGKARTALDFRRPSKAMQ